jgi:steroid delta-isomerase-like uncharacterized protein
MTFSEGELEENNKQVALQFYDVFNRHDPEEMNQLVSSNASYTFHFVGMPATDGKDASNSLLMLLRRFQILIIIYLDVVAEGDKVALRFNITGNHKGQFQDIPATGKKISVGCMNFLTIIDAKIIEEWSNSDMMGLMQQIGAIPVLSSAVNTG